MTRSTRNLLWLFAPYIVVSIVHVAASGTALAPPTKMLLMPALAQGLLVLGAIRRMQTHHTETANTNAASA